jgi:L-ascorbate metabolism protein UlaG (beta-lactamase superfamily)
MQSSGLKLTYVGHATVLIEMDGTRILTDPLLRNRLLHLVRYGKHTDASLFRNIDAVLISHIHLDHLDIPSLRKLPRDTLIILPTGAKKILINKGFTNILEISSGEIVKVGSISILGTEAVHNGFRLKYGVAAETLGYILQGSHKIYFSGDTEVFPEMAGLQNIDIALIAVWGWGPTLGKGHMDPHQAARAIGLIKPKMAVPIHWGSFYPFLLNRILPQFLVDPPEIFASFVSETSPQTEVKILPPGESLKIAG